MARTEMPSFAVISHRRHLGYVSAVSHEKAAKRAARLFPEYATSLEVELCHNRKARPSDRLNANKLENAKCSRRYGSAADFEARRAAMLAAFKAGEPV